jgi:hypothetical protein
MDRRSYPITVRDARKACRLRATRRQLRATLGRRQGARNSTRRQGGWKLYAVEPDGRPKKIASTADGFDSFQPTVGPKRSVTVKAKYFYGVRMSINIVLLFLQVLEIVQIWAPID